MKTVKKSRFSGQWGLKNMSSTSTSQNPVHIQRLKLAKPLEKLATVIGGPDDSLQLSGGTSLSFFAKLRDLKVFWPKKLRF